MSLLYGAAVYFWHDPVTDLWARWKQHGLESELDKSFAQFEVEPLPPTRQRTVYTEDDLDVREFSKKTSRRLLKPARFKAA